MKGIEPLSSRLTAECLALRPHPNIKYRLKYAKYNHVLQVIIGVYLIIVIYFIYLPAIVHLSPEINLKNYRFNADDGFSEPN